jgi:hypothetical protein
LEFLARRSIRQEEEIKGMPIDKELVMLAVFVDDMVLYLKDPKNSTQKLLHIINSFSTAPSQMPLLHPQRLTSGNR